MTDDEKTTGMDDQTKARTDANEPSTSVESNTPAVQSGKPGSEDGFDPVRELLKSKEAEIARLRKSREALKRKLREAAKPVSSSAKAVSPGDQPVYNKGGASQKFFDLLRGRRNAKETEQA